MFIAANHQAGAVTLYLSDATGRFFVKSLENVMAVNRSENFKVDLYEVRRLLLGKFDMCVCMLVGMIVCSNMYVCLYVSYFVCK